MGAPRFLRSISFGSLTVFNNCKPRQSDEKEPKRYSSPRITGSVRLSVSVQMSTSCESGSVLSTQLRSFVTDEENVQVQGEILQKVPDGSKLKACTYNLIGKELYVYRKKNLDEHKKMHSLARVFFKDVDDEKLDNEATIYSFKLIFPPHKARSYYFTSKSEKEKWVTAIKKVIGHSNVLDYYDIKNENLGKGSAGEVRVGINKQTGKEIAVKIIIIKKKDLEPK